MKRLAVLACLLSTSVFAQQAAPCHHNATRMAIGGVDLDAMRCQLSTAMGQVGDLTSSNIALIAQLRMNENDLKAANERADQAEKALAEARKPKS